MIMDKLQSAGQSLGRVFNSKSGCMCAGHLFCYKPKQLNLKLKTWPKQLLGSLPIAYALPTMCLFPQISMMDQYHQDGQVHDVPDPEEVRKSDFEDLQGLLDDVVEDEGAVDDAAPQDEEVPAVDVLRKVLKAYGRIRISWRVPSVIKRLAMFKSSSLLKGQLQRAQTLQVY